MNTSATDPAATGRAGRREWFGLALLALPTMVIGLDLTVLHLAVPALSAELRPSSTQLLWITDIYGFMIAGFLITMGTLGDRLGRRRLLLIGASAFAVASVIAAYSTSPEMLIAARALLGFTGATLMPSTLSLISNMFTDPKQRSFAIAAWMINFMLGGAIGPLVGGALLEQFWWGSVFLIAVPVMAVLVLVGPTVLPEYRTGMSARVDASSVILSLVAILSVIYGIKEIAKAGSPLIAFTFVAAGLIVGAVFARRQRRLADPLMDLSLLARRRFSTALGAQLTGLLIVAGVQFLILQYMQLVLGVSALRAGALIVPAMVGAIISTLLAPALARRMGHGPAIVASFVVTAVGLVMITQVSAESGLVLGVLGFSIVTVAVNPALALTYDLVLGSAPPERAGSASGMAETASELGLALGVAVAGSIATAVYRRLITPDALPEGMSADAADASQQTLAGAIDAADGLPAESAQELLGATREAFTQGVQLTGLASAGMAVVMAALVAVLLRERSTRAQAAETSVR